MMTETEEVVEMQSIFSISEDEQEEEKPLPITEFCVNNKLPSVIHISEKYDVLSPLLHPYFNIPLLAYKTWRDKVVLCRATMRLKDGTYQDTRPNLFIPSVYEGLFEIIPTNDHIGHYVSIAEIAEIMPSKFFTCTALIGMSIVKKDDGNCKYIQKSVAAGSTLTIDSIFMARWKTEVETGFFKKTKIKYNLTEKKYLKCLDSHKEDVYIPLSDEGRFYIFYEQGKTGRHVVYRINEFSREFEFPLKVRLIYGTSPVRNVKFTDLLTLDKEEQLETIVACTIGLDKHHLIDIPIKAGVYFKLQHYENVTESNDSNLKTAMAFSRKYVPHYQCRIRQSMEYDEAGHNDFTDQQQDGVKMPLDLLKDLSVDKQNDEDVKTSIVNIAESSSVA